MIFFYFIYSISSFFRVRGGGSTTKHSNWRGSYHTIVIYTALDDGDGGKKIEKKKKSGLVVV